MIADNDTLRMAAVLVARLDREMADVLLARLSPAEARRVRAAVVELGEVSEDEAEDALDQLARQRSRAALRKSAGVDAAGLEIDDHLAHRLAGAVRDEADFIGALAPQHAAPAPPAEEAPFRFLHEARMDELAARLGREHPQAIAVVLASLPPSRAAEALSALADAVQVEVIRRLATMEPADAVVIREIEDTLRGWIAPVAERRPPSVGMTAAQRILSASNGATQRHVLDALAARDETLATSLGRAPTAPAVPKTSIPLEVEPRPSATTWTFSDLDALRDEQLAQLWREADPDVGLLALAAASNVLVDRVLEALDEQAARDFCRQLDELGPVALADLDAAQQELATLAATMFSGMADTALLVHGGIRA